MRKIVVLTLVIAFVLFTFVGCQPKYVAAESMTEVYSMAIKELEKAKTPSAKSLANQKIKLEILKAITWYLQNDDTNPRIKELNEMLSLTED